MTARRLDLTIAGVGIVVLGAAAAGAAGRAWYHALTVPLASDRLAYQDVTVALLALGLLGLYPLSTIMLTLISRPATPYLSSRRAGQAPVESRIGRRRSGSRRTSRAPGWTRLVRHKTAGGGARLTLPGDAAAGLRLPARRTRLCSPTVRRAAHQAPGRETASLEVCTDAAA